MKFTVLFLMFLLSGKVFAFSLITGGKYCFEKDFRIGYCSQPADWEYFRSALSFKGSDKLFPLRVKEKLLIVGKKPKKLEYSLVEDPQYKLQVLDKDGNKVGGGYIVVTTDFQSFHYHFTFETEGEVIDQHWVMTEAYISRQGLRSNLVNTYPRFSWNDKVWFPRESCEDTLSMDLKGCASKKVSFFEKNVDYFRDTGKNPDFFGS